MEKQEKIQFLEELKQRKILKDITNPERFFNLCEEKGVYVGFDPTAESLHLGNYIAISLLKRFKKKGIKVLAVIGGATGMIGDPSFNSKERVLLDKATLKKNTEKIKAQIASFGLPIFDNFQIYSQMNVLEFLRDVGKNINISYLLAKDSVASRIQTGLSFTEFSYQLIQGWDFKFLYEKMNIIAQAGGSDQWGNMMTGLDFIRKSNFERGDEAFVFTTNLLTDENGQKFGKSLGKPIWLDKNMFSPYNLYQFLLNQSDLQAEKILYWLSFLEIEKINSLISEHNKNRGARILQKQLAQEIVLEIHGEAELRIAEKISNILFKNFDFSKIGFEEKKELKKILPYFLVLNFSPDDLVKNGIFLSKRELNEFISNKSLEINGKKILDIQEISPKLADFFGLFLVKKGKKEYFILESKKN
ncbi:tyrosine--tRNA ligase [Mycoplasma sp. 'Moose RK']|uniref:tyrosine--tRNA ligase n=1 Tax=Mycoplasma sp. 'Moose RK' TaxID=2780095 RepID=UPI0018C22813|nr:tyrosine--tRNA ligase [Mycoplasma sp. 'Moose RK']MBG0731034.1 tyrosine--tRNA ligase [Mycoplasma sp. 'Moose RK']